MNPRIADLADNRAERGEGRVPLWLDIAVAATQTAPPEVARRARLDHVLRIASTQRLKQVLADQLAQGRVLGAMRVSAELTGRGVPPCFRYATPFIYGTALLDDSTTLTATQRSRLDAEGAIVIRDGERNGYEAPIFAGEREFIAVCADLQWIAARYPAHKPEWERASGIFDSGRFMRTAAYLYWDGQRTPGQLAKALALNEAQQRECAWVRCLHVERWWERLTKRLALAQAEISSAVVKKDRRPVDEQEATIRRRTDLWLCAELGNWKPQRTANLFTMLTGQAVPRNLVARQLERLPKVRRSDAGLAF